MGVDVHSFRHGARCDAVGKRAGLLPSWLAFWLAVLVCIPAQALPVDAAEGAPQAPAAGAAVDPVRLAAALAIADAAVRTLDAGQDDQRQLDLSLSLRPRVAGLSFEYPALEAEQAQTPVLRESNPDTTGPVTRADQMSDAADSARLSGPVRSMLFALRSDPSYGFLREHQRLLMAFGFIMLLGIGGFALALRRQRAPTKKRRQRRSEPGTTGRSTSGSASSPDRQRRRRRTSHAR